MNNMYDEEPWDYGCEEEAKTDSQIFAEALALIIDNQIKIKQYIGSMEDSDYFRDCSYDEEIIEQLYEIE